MKTHPLLVGLASLGLMLTGCARDTCADSSQGPPGGSPSTSTGAPSGTTSSTPDPLGLSTEADRPLLVDKTWYLTHWVDADRRTLTPPPGLNPWVRFEAEEIVGADTCNDILPRWGDEPWSLEGTTLTLPGLRNTSIGCTSPVYRGIAARGMDELELADAARIQSDELELLQLDGPLLWSFSTTPRLVGLWRLTGFTQADGSATEFDCGQELELSVWDFERVTVESGCGRISADYTITPDALSFSNLTVDRYADEACNGDPALIAQRTGLVEALEAVTGFGLARGATLDGLDGSGEVVLKLQVELPPGAGC